MPGRVLERKNRRMPCVLKTEGQRRSGLITDVSPGGLFIQTSAKPRIGDVLDLEMSVPGEVSKLFVQVQVVRTNTVPAQLRALAHGGVGVQILNAPEAYYEFMALLKIGGDPG